MEERFSQDEENNIRGSAGSQSPKSTRKRNFVHNVESNEIIVQE